MERIRQIINGPQIFTVIIFFVVASCSSQPTTPVEATVPQYRTIAIMTPEDIIALKGAETSGSKAAKGATYGAASGAAGGAIYGSLACIGPWWALCAGAFSVIGLVGGAASGAALGFEGVSKEDSLYIMEELTNLRQNRNFQQELADGVITRLPPDILDDPATASAQAIMRITTVDFVEKNNDAVYMKVSAKLVIVTKDGGGDIARAEREIAAFSDRYPLEEWLGKGAGIFESSANECMEQLITKTSSTILQFQEP